MSEVVDEQSLRAYLNDLPDEKRIEMSLLVASRAALRVLPVVAHSYANMQWNQGETPMPVAIFAAALLSAVVGSTSKIPLTRVATAVSMAAEETATPQRNLSACAKTVASAAN